MENILSTGNNNFDIQGVITNSPALLTIEDLGDSENEQENFSLTVKSVVNLDNNPLFQDTFGKPSLPIETSETVGVLALGNYLGTAVSPINTNNNPIYQDFFLSTESADWVEDIEDSNKIDGLNFDELTGQRYNAREGTVIQFDIDLEGRAEFSFDWKFFTNEDYNEWGGTKENYDFNDFAFVAIDSKIDILTSYQKADLVEAQDSEYLYSTADYQTYSKTLGSGTYTITIGLFDEEDGAVDSGLDVQNFELGITLF